MQECSDSMEICEPICEEIVNRAQHEISLRKTEKIRIPYATSTALKTARMLNKFARLSRDTTHFDNDQTALDEEPGTVT